MKYKQSLSAVLFDWIIQLTVSNRRLYRRWDYPPNPPKPFYSLGISLFIG